MSDEQSVQAKRPPDIKEVHILWITAGLGCDGDSVSITAATLAQHRGRGAGRHPRPAQSAPAQPGAGLRGRRRVHEVLLPGRGGHSSDPFVLVVEGSIPNEKIKTGRLLGRLGHRPARPASRSPPASGSTGWRPRPWPWSPPAPAPPTAASTPWRAIPPAAWAWPTTWAGIGSRKAGLPDRQRARAARCSRTISWRRCCTCCTRRPGWRR